MPRKRRQLAVFVHCLDKIGAMRGFGLRKIIFFWLTMKLGTLATAKPEWYIPKAMHQS